MKFASQILLAGLFVGAAAAQAVPVKFPECQKNVRVNHVKGGSGALLNEDCTVLYVLPPAKNAITVNGYAPDATLGDTCEQLRIINRRITTGEKIIEDAVNRVKNLSKKIAQIEEDIAHDLYPAGENEDSMRAKMNQLMEDVDQQTAKVEAWQKRNNEARLAYGTRAGGRGVFTLDTSMEDLVSAYRSANSSLQVVAMPIDQNYLSINEISPDKAGLAALPAVLSLRSSSLPVSAILLDPRLSGESKFEGAKVIGGAIANEIVLSEIGACALEKARGNVSRFKIADFGSFVAASTTYVYQVQVTRKHRVSYDFQELVRQIQEQGKSGGLFSTKTFNNLIDNRSASAWLKFEVSSQDQRYQYSDEYIREVKKEFLDRALAQIISLKTGSSTALMALIEPGKSGMSEAGDQAAKCPHAYCQLGAAGFKILDSIFGSSRAVSDLLKTVNSVSVEEVTERRMVPAYGTTSFK